MTDRTGLGLVALLVLSAGCLGVLTGSEPFVATASDVGVSDSALSDTDFQPGETRTAWLNRTVDVAGQEREVRIRNYVATYQMQGAISPDGSVSFGLFSVFSTPKVSIAGQALNPIGRMPHQQLVEQVSGQSGDVRDIQQEGARELTVLGSSTEVTRFSAVVQRSGQEIPVYIEVARVEDGDDYVIGVGVYPQASADHVQPQVERLFTGIEH